MQILQELDADLDKSQIIACYQLGKTSRTTVKFLNRKEAETVFLNKKKSKDVNISCFLSDSNQYINDANMGDQNIWKAGGQSIKRKLFISQNLYSYYRYLYSLVKKTKLNGVIIDSWV